LSLDQATAYAPSCIVTVSSFWLSVWLFALLRCCVALAAAFLVNLGGELPAAPARFLALHSALPAPRRRGSRAAGSCAPEPPSLAAASLWEVGVPDSLSGRREKRQKPRVLFMRVLYRPDLVLLLGGFCFLTLAAVCEIRIRYYTGKVIDNLREDFVPDDFLSALLLMGVFSVGSAVGAGSRGGLLMWAINSFKCRVKAKLFRVQTNQEMAFFDTVKTGELTSLLSKDIPLMAETVCLNINVLLRTLIQTVYTLALMVNLSWMLTCLVLLEVPVTGFIQTISNKKHRRLTQAVHDSMTAANETANEIILAVRTVRSFNAEKHEARHYDDRLMDTHRVKTRRETVRFISLLAQRLIGLAVHVLMLWYGRLFIQRGQMTTGNLVSFILYQSDIGHNIRTLIHISGNMLNSVGAAGKVFEVLDRRPRIRTDGKLAPESLAGHVIFRHVNFAYPAHPDVTVLQDFSLELPAGQTTALVGVSGEGKSTCVTLLKRLYELQDGEILLDQADEKVKIAVVSQEPVLFHGSVRHNIAYGLEDCSLDAIQEAARQANAHDFISRLEKGYDTGERKRTSASWAVADSETWGLLKLTSACPRLDVNSVLQGLLRRSERSVLLITHRLKRPETIDQIAVIGGGGVRERGTHRQLMDQKGIYYKMAGGRDDQKR
uniref:Transporter associated with antigen processing, subunit type a n=1 Tax=Hippocampus comes TaxID=109280 RepID=A0A3Q2YVQ3_HIPCM